MYRTSRRALGLVVIVIMALLYLYIYRFYPQQQMPIGKEIEIKTPEYEKYRDDCLHPCIREIGMRDYVMVQSPYYAWNNQVENPMIYRSCSLTDWGDGILLADTPEQGYNSDPNVFVEDSSVFAFWRACGTSRCRDNNCGEIVIGGKVNTVDSIDAQYVYISNSLQDGDVTQCPIMLKHDGKYMFYAVWYQYAPKRQNKGIAIWAGSSLENPDFELTDTVLFDNPLVCDKLFQKKIGNRIYYIPVPKRYDLWHFDLFEYDDNLFMVSCAEKDDNIMLSVSTDWKHFKTSRRPLVNNHYSECYMGYRQYYYKPTAIVQNDSLYLYYTANAQEDPKRNQLFLSVKAMKDLEY